MKIALVQMRTEAAQPRANLERATDFVKEAAQAGANIVLLPEALDTGWLSPSAKDIATPIPYGETSRYLSELAKEHSVYLCAGHIERDEQSTYNCATLFNDEGKLLLRHRKIHELDLGLGLYELGGIINVANTRHGRIGLMIGTDALAHEHFITRTLGHLGADIILCPSSHVVPANHDNEREPYGQQWLDALRPLAWEFRMNIFTASDIGPIEDGAWAGRLRIGCSLALSSEGEILATGEYGYEEESILYAEIPD